MMEIDSPPPGVTRTQGFMYAVIYFVCVGLVSALVMLAPQESFLTTFHLLAR